MQSNGSKGQKPYHRPGSHLYRTNPRQDSPRRRGRFGHLVEDAIGHQIMGSYSTQSSGGPPRTEAHPGPKRTEWLEYFSPEQRCTMEYNPLTGETRSTAEPTKRDQVGTVSFFPGEESSPSLERARQTMEQLTRGKEANISRVVANDEGTGAHPLDNSRPRCDRLSEPSHTTGSGASPVPSSLRVPDNSTRAAVQSSSLPDPVSSVNEKDRPATVRDMEHFAEAIQATIREMGIGFIKAIAELHQEENSDSEPETYRKN